MSDAPQFIAVDEARATILAATRPLGAQRCLIGDALGRRIAESVVGPHDAPAFDNSAMDGFAFAHAAMPGPFRIVGESAAGRPFGGRVGAGEAVRIMTGAAVPDGCDTVAMREVCEAIERELRVDGGAVTAGDHIRRRGEFMRAGEDVIERGTLLRPSDLGLLASFGRTVVAVQRAARVGIITTGSELVEPDRARGPSQIYNSNAYMLEALVREAGGIPLVAPIVEDDEVATRRAIGEVGETSDLVVTVGGVSVGDYDFVRQILDELTGGMTFWKVRMKPGKPLAFGKLQPRGVGIIGLPGNPVSSFVAFHQFVAPALAALHGTPPQECVPGTVTIEAATTIESTPHRREYVLGHIAQRGGVACFVPHENRSSGNVLSMHRCDAFAVIEEGVELVACGELVRVERL